RMRRLLVTSSVAVPSKPTARQALVRKFDNPRSLSPGILRLMITVGDIFIRQKEKEGTAALLVNVSYSVVSVETTSTGSDEGGTLGLFPCPAALASSNSNCCSSSFDLRSS